MGTPDHTLPLKKPAPRWQKFTFGMASALSVGMGKAGVGPFKVQGTAACIVGIPQIMTGRAPGVPCRKLFGPWAASSSM